MAIEYRWAEGRYDRLPALAADLVGRKVDVIVAIAAPSILTAKTTTSTIPIVFLTGTDPVGDGLVASLARPGGNLTGVSILTLETMPKRLELISELVPKTRVIALLVNPNNPNAEPIIRGVQEAARTKGVQLDILSRLSRNQTGHSGALTPRPYGQFWMIRRPHPPKSSRALRVQRKRTLWSSHFGVVIIPPRGFDRHQILLTTRHEFVHKRLKASAESEIVAAFISLLQLRAGALLVGTDPFFTSNREQLVALASAMPFRRCMSIASSRGWRPDQLWSKPPRHVAPARHLRRKDSQGREAGRSAGAATDDVRAGRQSQDREGARPYGPPVDPCTRRRGHRMSNRLPREAGLPMVRALSRLARRREAGAKQAPTRAGFHKIAQSTLSDQARPVSNN